MNRNAAIIDDSEKLRGQVRQLQAEAEDLRRRLADALDLLGRYQRGRQARTERRRQRCERLHQLIEEYRKPTTTDEDWQQLASLLELVAPDLARGRRRLDPTSGLAPRTISPAYLRRAYRAWLRRRPALHTAA